MTQYFYQFLNGLFITVCLVLTALLHLFLWHLFIQSTSIINATYFCHYCVLQSGRRLSLRERERLSLPGNTRGDLIWAALRFSLTIKSYYVFWWLAWTACRVCCFMLFHIKKDKIKDYKQCVNMIVIFFNKTDNYRKPCVFKRTQRNSTMCENHVLIQIMNGE